MTAAEQPPLGEAYARELLEAAPAALFVLDAAGAVVYENPAARALWGYSPGQRPSETFAEAFRLPEPARAALQGVLAGREAAATLSEIVVESVRSGRRLTVELRITRLASGAVVHVSDISELALAKQFGARLIEHLPIGVSVMDTEGRVISHNRAMGQSIGNPDLSLLGVNFLQLDSLKKVRPDLLAAIEGKPTYAQRLSYQSVLTGKHVNLVTWYIPLQRGDQVEQVMVLQHDISKLVETENALRAERLTLERANQEIRHIHQLGQKVNATLNLQEVMETSLAAFREIFEFDCLNLLVVDADKNELLLHSSYGTRPFTAEAIEVLRRYPIRLDGRDSALSYVINKGKPIYLPKVTAEMMVNPADARYFEAFSFQSVLLLPIFVQGRGVGCVGFYGVEKPFELSPEAIERIERYLASLGAAIHNAQLHEALARTQAMLVETERKRAEAMAAAKDAAEAAAQAKSAFLANMSHEIRTPLTAIIGYAESLQDRDLSASERDQFAATIIRNGRHLLSLINDVLDFSKIEANKLAVERLPTELPALLQDAYAAFEGKARERGLTLELHAPPPLPRWIETDPTRLRQILFNLLSNAIKFTDRGSVRLEVTWDKAQARLTLAVADTGIGMSEEQLARLFEPFTQADASVTRRYGGTGLGLAISRQLAELLGGRLEARSELGVGSRFELSVAAAGGDELTDGATALLQRTAGERLEVAVPTLLGRVLCAEDNPDNQRLIARLIRRTGAEVALAGNGRLAVEMALREPFDLVLMDIQMPELSGLEALQQLRARGFDRPVVAVTANVLPEDVRQYHVAGFDAYLPKPIAREGLYEILRRYLVAGVAARPPVPAPPRVRGSVLLAEDNTDIRAFLRTQLGQTGAEVRVAGNGREAVEAALAESFDLVLMDMEMPELDGLAAVRLLRQCGFGGPIYMLTANSEPDQVTAGMAAGCNGYLTKPVNLADLYGVVARHLASYNAPDAASRDPEMDELVEAFAARLPEMLSAMEEAAAADDWAALQGLVHQLKGSAASFGFPELTQLADVLQRRLRQQPRPDVSREWGALRAALAAVALARS